MKNEEDEAFDDLARKQGAWGGGFKAKQAMAADKMQESVQPLQVRHGYDWSRLEAQIKELEEALAQPTHCQCTACKNGILHASDCAVHNGPAYPAGECDCGVLQEPVAYVTGTYVGRFTYDLINRATILPIGTAFYAAPQQREWVGLTSEDTFEIGERLGLSDIAWVDLMQAIEAKLKDKNL